MAAYNCLRRVVAGGTFPHIYQSLQRSAPSVMLRPSVLKLLPRSLGPASCVRFISTSGKSKVVTTADKISTTPGGGASQGGAVSKDKQEESLLEKDENWMSFGYSLVDREEDEWAHHLIMFASITVLLCWGSFYFAYYPDFKNEAWAQREAYLELERRERCGLPLIDPNMIDPAKIDLPEEEELGDFEIVI